MHANSENLTVKWRGQKEGKKAERASMSSSGHGFPALAPCTTCSSPLVLCEGEEFVSNSTGISLVWFQLMHKFNCSCTNSTFGAASFNFILEAQKDLKITVLFLLVLFT